MIRMSTSPEAGTLAELFRSADQLLIAGNAEASLVSLLDAFEGSVENREEIQQRLLELFILVGDSEPEVLAARRRLATMLF